VRVEPFLFAAAMLLGSVAVPSPHPVPAALSCEGQTYEVDPAQERIRDGGFESGLLLWPTTLGTGGANSPVIVASPLHSGSRAAEVDAVDSPATHANQSIVVGEPFVFTFWFYPRTWGPGGAFAANLMANWDPNAGLADHTSTVVLSSSDPQVVWYAWYPRSGSGGGIFHIPAALDAGVWHSFEIVVDPDVGVQCLFVDGAFRASIGADPSTAFAPSQVLFGDVSYFGDAGVAVYDDLSIHPVHRVQQPAGACPLSQGFWKNHDDAWPVDSLALGAETYTITEMLDLLRTPPRGDASLILAHQLIAAKLNVANGSDASPISSVIAESDAILGGFVGKLPHRVSPSSESGGRMVAAASVLDDYNNGVLTPDCTRPAGDAPTPRSPATSAAPGEPRALAVASLSAGLLLADPRRLRL